MVKKKLNDLEEYEKAVKKLNKLKSRVAKDNFIRRMIKKDIYL